MTNKFLSKKCLGLCVILYLFRKTETYTKVSNSVNLHTLFINLIPVMYHY